MDTVSTNELLEAVAGRWHIYFEAAGIDGALLDGRRHACPKCNAAGSFVASSGVADDGIVTCDACFAEETDGVRVISWYKSWSLRETKTFLQQQIQRGLNVGTSKPDHIGSPPLQGTVGQATDGCIPIDAGADPGTAYLGTSDRPPSDGIGFAFELIEIPDGAPLALHVAAKLGQSRRIVKARHGESEFRDQVNIDSSQSRDRFIKKLADEFGIEMVLLNTLVGPRLARLADEADASVAHGDERAKVRESQAAMVASLASDWELWHTPDGENYATVVVNGHMENLAIKSNQFKHYVAKAFYDLTGSVMGSECTSAAFNLMAAQAAFEGQSHVVHVRVAEHDGRIYLDLANDAWQVVEIDGEGWRVLDESPVRFRRPGALLALPRPEAGGNIDMLREFLNTNDATFRLVVAWLVSALRPRGPYPVLALFAQQDSGKSTTARFIRRLIDPNTALLRSDPKDERDLMIMATNARCLAFDNLSRIPQWLSDAFCRLSTGGGFGTRKLYSDEDERIFSAQRPVLLTSIEEIATRSDLLDRCLVVELNPISDDSRVSEAELETRFAQSWPKILGALLDALATAIREFPTTKLPRLPRMADFATWATAAETAFGWAPGTFMSAYADNRMAATELAMDATQIAGPLLELLRTQEAWEGTASDLLSELAVQVGESAARQRGWPANGRGLSGQLTRLAPNLRACGWDVSYRREAKSRIIAIQRATAAGASSSFASSPPSAELVQIDADRCIPAPDDANDADDAKSVQLRLPLASNVEWEGGAL